MEKIKLWNGRVPYYVDFKPAPSWGVFTCECGEQYGAGYGGFIRCNPVNCPRGREQAARVKKQSGKG